MNDYVNETNRRPSPTAILNPRCDPIFKGIFTQGTEESNLALREFIAAIIGRKVKNVKLEPNEPPVETLSQMQMTFDVSVTFDNGEYADIEIQCRNQDYDYAIRSEIQAARLLNNNAKKGSNWHAEKVYQISVLNYEFDFDDNNPISWYTMRKDTGKHLGDRLNVIFLDLIKVKSLIDKPIEELTPAERWGMFFSYADDKKYREYIRKISEKEKGIMAADNTVQYMSEEDANWARQNSYFKAIRDYNTPIYNAEQRGIKKGEQNAKIEAAKNFLKLKVCSLEQIAQAVGLPIENVKELEKEVKN